MRVQSERYPQLILHALSKYLIESDAMMKLSVIDVLWRTTPAVVFLSRSSWLSTSWMAKGDGVQKTLDRQSVWFPWYYIFPLFPCFFFIREGWSFPVGDQRTTARDGFPRCSFRAKPFLFFRDRSIFLSKFSFKRRDDVIPLYFPIARRLLAVPSNVCAAWVCYVRVCLRTGACTCD